MKLTKEEREHIDKILKNCDIERTAINKYLDTLKKESSGFATKLIFTSIGFALCALMVHFNYIGV